MLSAEDFAAAKVSVTICNDNELKNEIINSNDFSEVPYFPRDSENVRCFSSRRHHEIERKTKILVGRLGLPNHLQRKVIGIVYRIGSWMRSWADYHEKVLGLSRSYIANFLNITLFTSQGMIDDKKAAEELLKDKSLSIKQHYQLACLYCFQEHIRSLYRQMSKKDRSSICDFRNPSNVKQPKLVTFWTCYILGKIAKLGDKHPYHYGFEVAVKSGNKVAAEYFLRRMNGETVQFHIICNALKSIKCNLLGWEHNWCVDILYFLLLKMREDEQIEFLMEDIICIMYDKYRKNVCLTALHSLLYWPYQNHFMKLANLMWGILPKWVYGHLLLAICDKINPEMFDFKYENEICDYRKLLNEYWCRSPEYYKNCVVSNELRDWVGEKVIVNAGRRLLGKLCLTEDFTVEDRNMYEMIFQCVKEKEMVFSGKEQEIISSFEGVEICMGLITTNNWKMAEEFLSHYLPSRGEICESIKQLMFTEGIFMYFLDFVKNDKFVEAEMFLRWSSLSTEEIYQFKKKVLHSSIGLKTSPFLFFDGKAEIADRFIKWSFSSEEEVKEFKKKLIFSNSSVLFCEEAILNSKICLVDEYISFCLSSEEIKEFKEYFSETLGDKICCQLISGYSFGYNGTLKKTDLFKFARSEWEQVNNFLSWCFSSDVEINNFKEKYLAVQGDYASLLEVMHLCLVIENHFKDIEILYTWFSLSPDKISRLKKETLLSQLGWKVLMDVFHKAFVDSVSWKTGEKLQQALRWCLIDTEAVSEFKCMFDKHYGFKYRALKGHEVHGMTRIRLKCFSEFIEMLLTDLNKKSGKKRKVCGSSTEFLNKRHCTVMLQRLNISNYS